LATFTNSFCTVCCGVSVACCSGTIPSTLTATIVSTDACSCLNGSYILTWNAGNAAWEYADTSGCSGMLIIKLECIVPPLTPPTCFQMKLSVQCSTGKFYFTQTPPSSCNCSPFSLSYPTHSGPVGGCCLGGFNVTITP
jgi:hypothetical protein